MKYFFVSDVHLGLSTHRSSQQIEQMFEQWLIMVHKELLLHPKSERGLFLVGDIFDFWLEYKRVVPKGFVLILAELKKMTRNNIDIYFIQGNHDKWNNGYLEKELGLKVIYSHSLEIKLGDKNFYLSHGDKAFANYEFGSWVLYKILGSRPLYKLFSAIVHPDICLWFGSNWSNSSRNGKFVIHEFTGDNEPVVKEVKNILASGKKIDYFVFGHLHSPIEKYKLTDSATLNILGQWIYGDVVYGVFDENGFYLENYNY